MEMMGRAVDWRVDIGRHAGTATAGDFWRSLVYLSPLESGARGAEADPVAGVAISDLRRGGGVHDHARSGQVSRGVLAGDPLELAAVAVEVAGTGSGDAVHAWYAAKPVADAEGHAVRAFV